MHRTGYIIILDFLMVVLCVFGVYRVALKAGLPVELDRMTVKNISESDSKFHIGDSILTISRQPIHSHDEIEFLCNQYKIGDSVTVQIVRGGNEAILSTQLVNDYSPAKIFIESLVGFIYLVVGI